MRTALLALAALVAATASAPAQGWAEKMFKDGASHDFGTVPKGAQSVHRFKVVNIYAVPMDITALKPSCGCVSATAAKRTLEPREESYIEVRMDGRRYSGKKAVTVTVTVGPTYVSSAILKISATGRADVVFNPGDVNFGLVAQGTTPTRTVDVEYAGRLDWKINEVVAADMPFTIDAKQLHRGGGQVRYRLAVTLKADAPAGILKNEIILKTNDPASPTVPLVVEGIVQPSLTVQPSALNLGAVKAGEALTRKVVVRGSAPFKITKVEGVGDGIELPAGLPAEAQAVHVLEVKVTMANPGLFRRELRITTSAQDGALPVVIDGVAGK